MNTRTVYHSLLWLSAACVAVFGLLLIQSHQRTRQAEIALQAERALNAQLRSQTPQEIERKAKRLVEKREKWGSNKVNCFSYYRGHRWTVLVISEEIPKVRSCVPQGAEMLFDDSGKLTSYTGSPAK